MAEKEKAVCETCKKEFYFYRSTLRGKKGRFCSRKCIRLGANRGSFKNQGALITGKCLTCGKEFKYFRSNKSKFCSKECFWRSDVCVANLPKDVKGEKNPFWGKKHKEGFRQKVSKENHWNWRGGVTPANIIERIKFCKEVGKQVLKRDNYTCQMCGARGNLHINHIQPWAEYVEGRFNINNCRTLCRKCHYKVTYGREMPPNSKWGLYHFNNKIL